MKAHCRILFPPKTPAQKALMDLDADFPRCPVDDLTLPRYGGWWFGYGYLQIRTIRQREVTITNVWVDPRYRNRGAGRDMFRELFKVCDRHSVACHLYARQFDRGGPNTRKLWAWYKRLGFERQLDVNGRPHRGGYATRRPAGY